MEMSVIEQFVLILSLITAVTSFFFGSLVYLNDRNARVNRLFFFLTLSIATWIMAAIVDVMSKNEVVSLLNGRIALSAAIMIGFFGYRFAYHYSRPFTGWKEYPQVIGGIAGAIFTLTLFTPFVLQEVWELQNGSELNKYGLAVYVFEAYFLILSAISLYMIAVKVWHARGKAERQQLMYVFIGAILSAIAAVTINLILPRIGVSGTLQLGAPTLLIFVGLAAYAIMRRHLFNTRVIATSFFSFLFIISSIVHLPFMGSGVGMYVSIFMFITAVIAVGFVTKSAFDELEQRKKLERFAGDLKKANDELVRLDSLRKEFFSFASHQLRQPLVIMKGYASLIYEGELGGTSPEMKRAAKKIFDATDQLNLLVNNFLDVRAIEEGKMLYAFRVLDVAALVKGVVVDYTDLAESRNLTLTFTADPEVIEGAVDHLKFKQVIQNLIDNALKYTKEGSIAVSITKKEQGGDIHLVVADSGIGIEESVIEHLFNEFMRDKTVVKRGIRGTGLGLYLIKKIVEAHGGKVWAESSGEGEGSAFHVELPSSEKFSGTLS